MQNEKNQVKSSVENAKCLPLDKNVIRQIDIKLHEIEVTKADFKDLKEIIDLHNEAKNKPFMMLVKKRIRIHENEENKEQFLKNFDKLSLDNKKQANKGENKKIDKKKKEKNQFKFIPDAKSEFHFKDQLIESIGSKRKMKIFTSKEKDDSLSNGRLFVLILVENECKIFKTFYPSVPDKEFFEKEKESILKDEISKKVLKRDIQKQEDFWDKRKNLKAPSDPAFEQVKALFRKHFGEGEQTQFINVDNERMLIVSSCSNMKQQ
jgi:hypothetical protein